MSETIFFEYEDVKVTNSRFMTSGQTYAMSNITSVKATAQKPSRTGAVIVLLIGFATMSANLIFGLLIAGAAAFYLYKQKTTYYIVLATAGGETKALTTYQRDYLNKIVEALNQAIIHRG